MKKLVLVLMLVGLISATITAQDSRSDPQFGLKAGINYANVYDEAGSQFTANGKIGFAGGAFLSIPIGRFLGVQPEILFSQKGYQGKSFNNGVAYSYSRTSNYLDIPLLIALKPAQGFTILGGPQYSYLMKQVDKLDDKSVEINFTNNNIRKNILCLVFGFDINFQNLVVGARAGWDLQDNHGDGTSNVPRYKNVWYQATLGFRF